ncbi:hypothetical protein RRG08_053237 [Elysia crispata]|uniref:Uncharacterized protein n=1 Tax=Elysia crispata TaxID=231223 RepID=A0AAE1AND9_9GAST|nr:hypothetical protein RRG08_053237 [Elysia crispata]
MASITTCGCHHVMEGQAWLKPPKTSMWPGFAASYSTQPGYQGDVMCGLNHPRPACGQVLQPHTRHNQDIKASVIEANTPAKPKMEWDPTLHPAPGDPCQYV